MKRPTSQVLPAGPELRTPWRPFYRLWNMINSNGDGPALESAAASEAGRTCSWALRSTTVALGMGLVVASLIVARREWFVGDDFFFLQFVQSPRGWRDWVFTFLPFGVRTWWSYRPLTVDVFFYVARRVFDLSPFPYLMVNLVGHFASGIVLYRIARQLAFAQPVALVVAIMSVSRYPSMEEIFWASAFQHVGAKLFYLTTVMLFLDHLHGNSPKALWASCAATVVTLLCNEIGASICVVLLLFSLHAGSAGGTPYGWIRRLYRVGPHFVITAIYLLFRLRLFGPSVMTMPLYRVEFGPHILSHYILYLRYVFDDSWARLMTVFLLIIGLMVVLPMSPMGSQLRRGLLAITGVCGGWIVIAMAPFVGMPWSHPRLAMIIEPPVWLLVGAYVDCCWAIAGRRFPRAAEMVLVALLATTMPYRQLWERSRHPRGEGNRQLAELARRQAAAGVEEICVIVLYGGPGLGDAKDEEVLGWRTWGKSMLVPFYPGRKTTLVTHNVRKPIPAELARQRCAYAKLKPGGGIESTPVPFNG